MNNSALNASLHNDVAQHGLPLNGLPLFADGLHLTEKELLHAPIWQVIAAV